MTIDLKHYQQLQMEKMQLVQSLTELNAKHIQSQSRLSGIEIDAARCKLAIDQGDTSENFASELRLLDKEFEDIMQSRALIDNNRDTLEQKINELDSKLANAIESTE